MQNLKADRRPRKVTIEPQLPIPAKSKSQAMMPSCMELGKTELPKSVWQQSVWLSQTEWLGLFLDGPFHPLELHWVHWVLIRSAPIALHCQLYVLNIFTVKLCWAFFPDLRPSWVETVHNVLLCQSVYCIRQSITPLSCLQKKMRDDKKDCFVANFLKIKI